MVASGLMKRMIILSMCLAMFAACKKGGDCAAAADKAVASDKHTPPEIAGKVKDVMVKRCTEDKWPKEAVDCFLNAKDDHEAKACGDKIPKDAQEKLMGDLMPIMMGAMSKHMGEMGGSAMTPPPAPSMAPAGSGEMGSAAAPAGSAAGSAEGSAAH